MLLGDVAAHAARIRRQGTALSADERQHVADVSHVGHRQRPIDPLGVAVPERRVVERVALPHERRTKHCGGRTACEVGTAKQALTENPTAGDDRVVRRDAREVYGAAVGAMTPPPRPRSGAAPQPRPCARDRWGTASRRPGRPCSTRRRGRAAGTRGCGCPRRMGGTPRSAATRSASPLVRSARRSRGWCRCSRCRRRDGSSSRTSGRGCSRCTPPSSAPR